MKSPNAHHVLSTKLTPVAKEVTKMLFLPSVSFISGWGEMTKTQGAKYLDIGKLRGLSVPEGWSRAGRMRSLLNRWKKMRARSK